MAAYDPSKLPSVSPEDDLHTFSSLGDKIENGPAKLKDADPANVEQRIGVHSDSEGDTIGRQIELESENTIKYRTCSWQKVC